MNSTNGKGNGSHERTGHLVGGKYAPPRAIADLAEGCVLHVQRLLGVKLDYEPETLPLLDHYLSIARAEAQVKPEILSMLAQTTGAYLGEVVRRRHPSWWRMEGSDPSGWMVEFESVYLAFSPVRLVLQAVLRVGTGRGLRVDSSSADREKDNEAEDEEGLGGREGGKERERVRERDAERAVDDELAARVEDDGESEVAPLELEEEDRLAVAARLSELPPVSDEEFYAPSTRVEVIDIAVEAIRARRMAAGDDAEANLRPNDYERSD